MKKKLDLLEELQNIDYSIDEKRAEQAVFQADIAELEKSLDSINTGLADQQAELARLMSEKNAIEATLHTELENIKRSETNMKEIRTNKEFQAVGREITAARKQVTELEDQLLQITVRSDEIQALIDKSQAELDDLSESVSSNKKEKLDDIASLQEFIDTVVVKREQIIKTLSGNLVRRYNQLREQRRGQAVAIARDGSCMGCNMQLPPQLYNTLFKGDDMYFCPHCQRILILKPENPSVG